MNIFILINSEIIIKYLFYHYVNIILSLNKFYIKESVSIYTMIIKPSS